MGFWRRVKEDYKAHRRGEVRVAPGMRGRVYKSRADLDIEAPAEPGLQVKARPKATISARVYRAATGEWEDLGVIAEADVREEG